MASPRSARTRLGEVLEARRIKLGYPTLAALAAKADVSTRTITDLLSGNRKTFRTSVIGRLNLAWRLPPGTLEHVLAGRLPADAILGIAAGETGPEFLAQLWTELTARGAQLGDPAELARAAEVFTTTGALLASAGLDQIQQESFERASGVLAALADLLKAAGLDARTLETLTAVDAAVTRFPHLTAEDVHKLRVDALQRAAADGSGGLTVVPSLASG